MHIVAFVTIPSLSPHRTFKTNPCWWLCNAIRVKSTQARITSQHEYDQNMTHTCENILCNQKWINIFSCVHSFSSKKIWLQTITSRIGRTVTGRIYGVVTPNGLRDVINLILVLGKSRNCKTHTRQRYPILYQFTGKLFEALVCPRKTWVVQSPSDDRTSIKLAFKRKTKFQLVSFI